MPKDPAVLLYTSDFLSGTFTMSNEQVGKYIRLLCLQHQKGHLTKKDMLNICSEYDEEIFSKFELIDGVYVNKRMYEESVKRKNYSDSRRNNRTKNISTTYDKHMENENEIIIENVDVNRIWHKWKTYKYDEFKDKFKTVESEKIALNKLLSLGNNDVKTIEEIVDTSIANHWKGLFQIKTIKQNDKLNNFKQLYTSISESEWAREIDAQLPRSNSNFTTMGESNT